MSEMASTEPAYGAPILGKAAGRHPLVWDVASRVPSHAVGQELSEDTLLVHPKKVSISSFACISSGRVWFPQRLS